MTTKTTTIPPLSDPILVVGGMRTDTVELLGLRSGTESVKLGKLPKKIGEAVGTTLNGIPHICGGMEDKSGSLQGYVYEHLKECWAYNAQNDEWTVSGRMSEARSGAAAASHPSHGWVITGGSANPHPKSGYRTHEISTAESTRDGRSFQPFPQLPLGLGRHCLVSLEGGDSGDFLLTGGKAAAGWQGYNKATFIYREGEWRQVADMSTARNGLMCGAVRSSSGGPVMQVVAAGGYGDGTPVEIYDLASNTWTTRGELPLSAAAVVPFETTFLIIGGSKSSDYKYTDKVYKYTAEGDWHEMPIKLTEVKGYTTAMIVHPSLFD